MSPSLQDWLPPKHPARLIVEIAESLDLRPIEDKYKGRGESAYRPKMLVAMLFYGYSTGVFSCSGPITSSAGTDYIGGFGTTLIENIGALGTTLCENETTLL
jgi:hypothetical protein